MFVSPQFGYFLKHFEFFEGQVVFELSIKNFGLVEVYFDVERVVDEDGIVLFVVHLQQSVPED